MTQPPYQPATPQEPAPREGQPNFPNIEKFNEQGARDTDQEMAQSVIEHLKGGVEQFESWDDVIDHLQWLVDTGNIGLFQPPNISEEEFKTWEPIIKGLMSPQTRFPDLKEEQGGYSKKWRIKCSCGRDVGVEGPSGVWCLGCRKHPLRCDCDPIESKEETELQPLVWQCDDCGKVFGETDEDFNAACDHLEREHGRSIEFGHHLPIATREPEKWSPTDILAEQSDDKENGDVIKCPQCDNPYAHTDLGTGDSYCSECGYHWNDLDDEPVKQEPDPSNPDKELDKDPDIPEPAEPDEDRPVTMDGLEVPDKIEIPERLYNDLMMMIEYSTTNDNEAGGFLIKAKHGELGVVGEQFGKDREIVLEPNEQLHEGEELIGTVHMHPVTPTASTGDVSGYMNDENEKVMLVVGADKSINVFFKTSFTAEGDYGEEISDNFEQSDMNLLAEGLGFIWYRGEESDRTTLNLITNVVDNVELNIVEETWPIEDLVKGLGIKGRPDIPEEYSTKKTPLRLQIPFSYCNERRLI